MTPEQQAQDIIGRWFVANGAGFGDLGKEIASAIREASRLALESAAQLHESVNPASDEERLHGSPGAGAMGAVIEYRDKIRALADDKGRTG